MQVRLPLHEFIVSFAILRYFIFNVLILANPRGKQFKTPQRVIATELFQIPTDKCRKATEPRIIRKTERFLTCQVKSNFYKALAKIYSHPKTQTQKPDKHLEPKN